MALSITAALVPVATTGGTFVFTTTSTLGATPPVGSLVVIVFSQLDPTHNTSEASGHWTKDRAAITSGNGHCDIWSRVFDGTENALYTFSFTAVEVGTAVWMAQSDTPGGRWLTDTGASNTAGNAFPATIGTTATLTTATSVAFCGGQAATSTTGFAISGGGTWSMINNDPGKYFFGSLITSATTALTPVVSKTSGATFISDGAAQVYGYIPPVGQDLTLRADIHGPVGQDLTLLAKIRAFMSGFTVRTEVAWSTDPLTRPTEGYVGAGGDWSRLSDVSAGILSLNIKRGTKILSAGLETGTATEVVENAKRHLDPAYTASVLAPNVKPRKRIRHVLSSHGVDVTLHTGFIERFTPKWQMETAYVSLPSQDLFGLLANTKLPPSVLDVVTRDLGPVAYWPMSETNGTQADDVVGTLDGTYSYPVQNTAPLVPFDPRKAPKFGRPTNATTAVPPNMTVYPFVANAAVSGSVWFKWDVPTLVPGLTRRETVFMLQNSTTPVTFSGSVGTKSVFFFPGFNDSTGEQKVGLVIRNGSKFNQIDSPISPWTLNIYDGQAHHLAFSIDGATKTRLVWVDGVRQTMHDNPDPSVSAISAIDVADVLNSVTLASVGWGIQWNSPSQNQDTAAVGNAVYFDRMLTDPEVLSIYTAGTNPWDGDTTGARWNRVLDIAGVDPADRDIDTGTQLCGPTILNSQNILAYGKKIVATEAGAAYVNGDGQVRFRQRPSSPPIVDTFSDDPTGDHATAAMQVTSDYGYDRIINKLIVGRENGADQTIIDQPSIDEFGELSGSIPGGRIDTLHRTADDARATGQFIIDAHKQPTSVIPSISVESIDETASLEAMTQVEIADLIVMEARPPGATAETLGIQAQVEAVEFQFPSPTEFVTVYTPGDGAPYP